MRYLLFLVLSIVVTISSAQSMKTQNVDFYFSYGSPNCFEIQKSLTSFQEKNKNINIKFIPVKFGRQEWGIYSKMYFTFSQLSNEEIVTSSIFKAIHERHINFQSSDSVALWGESLGFDRKTVKSVFDSALVLNKVEESERMTTHNNIQSIPAFIINGEVVQYSNFKSNSEFLQKIEALLSK